MNRIIRWEPFREMEDMFRRFKPWAAMGTESPVMEWRPMANVSKLEGEYVIKADLPEVKKEDVKVTVRDGTLTITGERKLEKEAKGEDRLTVESFYGSFERSFGLPDDVDEEGIRAESRDGVLRVHLPRKKTTAAHKEVAIPIQ